MPIDLDRVLGASLPGNVTEWREHDVILYHLGIGAGFDPTDPKELEYLYEARLKVLPSFGVLGGFSLLPSIVSVDGLEFNPMLLLHGEQDLVLHQPLPAQGKVSNSGRITEVYDQGSGALLIVETETVDETGAALATNRFKCFLRGEGGFGGVKGPQPGNQPPDREPDLVTESPTLAQQALLYRLCGDPNPVHADPDIAKLAGFDRPILHGLSHFGAVCKAVVDHALDGDVSRVARYQVRFSGVVFPGETILTSMWHEGDRIVLSATTKERGAPVLTHAALTTRS
jgi:acyl dehydratase